MPKRANGEGTVYWSASRKRYVAQVSLGTKDGKPIRKAVYGAAGDKSRAAKLGVEERIAKYTGRRGRRDGTERLESFITKSLERADVRAKTLAQYRQSFEHIKGTPIASKTLLDIDPSDVREFYDSLLTGATAKQKVHVLLHRVFAEAVQLEMVARNPVSSVPKPKVPRPQRRALSPVEVAYLLKAAEGDRLRAVVVLALTSTMGPAELFGLRRSDLQLQGGYVVVSQNLVEIGGRVSIEDTKTPKRRRRIDLPKIAIDALRERLKIAGKEGHPSELVFTSDEGGPIRPNNLRRRWWKPLLERAAAIAAADVARKRDPGYRFPVELRMYDLRHTSNALMGLIGVPLQVASARMGHTSIKTTADVYGHLYSSQGKAVAEKFDAFFEKLPRPRKGRG